MITVFEWGHKRKKDTDAFQVYGRQKELNKLYMALQYIYWLKHKNLNIEIIKCMIVILLK